MREPQQAGFLATARTISSHSQHKRRHSGCDDISHSQRNRDHNAIINYSQRNCSQSGCARKLQRARTGAATETRSSSFVQSVLCSSLLPPSSGASPCGGVGGTDWVVTHDFSRDSGALSEPPFSSSNRSDTAVATSDPSPSIGLGGARRAVPARSNL